MNKDLAKRICKQIAMIMPFQLDIIEELYERSKSIDETILILEISQAFCISPFKVIELKI